MVNHDRFGLFRPTTNERGEVINADWKTIRNVHLDVSRDRDSGKPAHVFH